MKHLSIKFLLLIGFIIHLPCLIQAGRKPAGKRSPAQQQQYLAQQNRLRQAQLAQQEAARKEKEAQEAAALAAQQENEQEKEKQETSAVAPASAETTIQPQQPATQVTQSEAQPQDTSNQAEAMRYAQARAIQQKQAPMSLWRLAYLQLAPTAIGLLFKAIQEGTGTTFGALASGFAKRRQEVLALPGKEAMRQLQLKLLKKNPDLAITVPLEKRIKLESPVTVAPISDLASQAFYQGILSAAGSVVSALIINMIATGLQSLMPKQYVSSEDAE